MALPTAYLTATKNLPDILNAIKTAQAPEKFTISFLESLGFKSSSDRLIIGVLKSLGFLDDNGKPTSRYFEFLDQTQSDRVLAEGIREAYADLFRINVNAHEFSRSELKNKFKTLSQGKISDSVLEKMATTFTSLVKLADFSEPIRQKPKKQKIEKTQKETAVEKSLPGEEKEIKFGGLVYNIQIHLPESRDPAVYDAIFRSLKEHLL